MLFVFNHGQESGPDGGKIQALRAQAEAAGHTTAAMDYTDLVHDPDARVERLNEYLGEQEGPVALVGSSMGAYVATVAAQRRPVEALFLLAPAFYLDGYAVHDYRPRCSRIMLVHGWDDDVVPWEYSLRFGKGRKAEVHLIDGDHRLREALPRVQQLFANLLETLPGG